MGYECAPVEALKITLEGLVMVRRLKDAVIKALPSKLRSITYVNVSPEDRVEIDKTKRELERNEKESKASGLKQGRKEDLVAEHKLLINQFYKQSGECKIAGVVQELKKLIQAQSDANKEKIDAADREYQRQQQQMKSSSTTTSSYADANTDANQCTCRC